MTENRAGRISPKNVFLIARYYIPPRYVLYGAVGIAAFAPAYIMVLDHLQNPVNAPFWRIAIYLGTMFLILGWVVTSEISISNSKTQHTITLVTQYLFDPVHDHDEEILKKYFSEHNEVIKKDDIEKLEKDLHVYRSLVKELNYLEFMAVAHEMNYVNRKLLKKYLQSILVSQYDKSQEYIEYCRKSQSSHWENLYRLRHRWDPKNSSTLLDSLLGTILAGLFLTGIMWVIVDYFIF